MPYVSFEEYCEMGFGQIGETEFAQFAMLACDYIDEKTRRRAQLGKGFDVELKKAEALIAEGFKEEFAVRAAADGVVKAESNDGWSAQYAVLEPEKAADVFEKARAGWLRRYLGHTGWLYCGVKTE